MNKDYINRFQREADTIKDGNISDAMAYKKPVMSVGAEFVAWAETYWSLEKKYQNTTDPQDNSESVSFQYIRKAFIEHIDKIIKQRISDYL